jgi:hypothetical protein
MPLDQMTREGQSKAVKRQSGDLPTSGRYADRCEAAA